MHAAYIRRRKKKKEKDEDENEERLFVLQRGWKNKRDVF